MERSYRKKFNKGLFAFFRFWRRRFVWHRFRP